MTSIYNKTTHSLVEQPEIEPPIPNDASDNEKYKGPFALWNAHIASLRTIPCVPGSIWEENRLYDEDKDYEVWGADEWRWTAILRGNIFAAPIPKEDDLWKEVVDVIKNCEGAVIPFLQFKYTITKKTV